MYAVTSSGSPALPLLPAGSLELVGQAAGLTGEQLGAGVVASGHGLPVVDLQRDVPPSEDQLLGLRREPTLLRGEQRDLLAGSSRTELTVRHVLAHVAH